MLDKFASVDYWTFEVIIIIIIIIIIILIVVRFV